MLNCLVFLIRVTPSIMKIGFGTKIFWKDVCSAVNLLLQDSKGIK